MLRERCKIMNFMELRLGLMGAFGGKFRIPEQNSSMFLIDMEVGHTYLGYDIEYFCSEKSTSKILLLIIETKVKTVFELETCGFVIHQNYTISARIDTKKNGEKTVSQWPEIHS